MVVGMGLAVAGLSVCWTHPAISKQASAARTIFNDMELSKRSRRDSNPDLQLSANITIETRYCNRGLIVFRKLVPCPGWATGA